MKMRKYIEVAKVYFKTQFAWRADVVFNMIFTISRILFAYLLWRMVFSGKEMVSGFTFHGMLSYYIVSSFLSQLEMSGGISGEICQRIRNGTFSKYMILPVSMEGYFVAMEAGTVLFYLAFDLIAAFLWIFIFRIEFAFVTDGAVLLCAFCLILLGLFFMVQFAYYLGILTLKYQGIDTFLMIKNNLMALATGTIVPLALFPEAVVRAMRALPFYYVTYLPSMLLIGKCREEAATGIGIMAAWCLVMQILIRRTWAKYSRKYDGVGI